MTPSITLERLLEERAPQFLARRSLRLRRLILVTLDRILAIGRMNSFLERNRFVRGVDFIDEVFEEVGFSFSLSHADKARIPSEGPLIVVANHPLGGLDGLAVLRAISEVRLDVRIVANDVLSVFSGLSEMLLPVDVFRNAAAFRNARAIDQALEREEAVIFFPAGEVSRMKLGKVVDRPWNGGAVFFAKKHSAPVLPVFVGGRNSLLFYAASALSRPASTLLLPRLMLSPREKHVQLKVGGLIPAKAFEMLRTSAASKLLRRETYALKRNQRGPFRTERVVIHPLQRQLLIRQLSLADDLGAPAPGKRIYLATAERSPGVIREIARLREVTFRRVGEGTGRKLDSDEFDLRYRHLVVWDERNLEIAGAYRLGFCRDLLQGHDARALYTSTLFTFSDEMTARLPDSIELGRSFIQQAYWNSYVLDYLWAGIGAVIRSLPTVRYLFGPVSISNTYPRAAKLAIVHYFQKWYSPQVLLAASRSPLEFRKEEVAELQDYFCGRTLREDLNKLRLRLQSMNVTVPTLYRKYAELCEPGGVTFHGAGVDREFGDCVDSLVVVDLTRLTETKRERYLQRYTNLVGMPEPAPHAAERR